MTAKKAALVFGVVLLLVGVLGFVPALVTNDSMGMPLLPCTAGRYSAQPPIASRLHHVHA